MILALLPAVIGLVASVLLFFTVTVRLARYAKHPFAIRAGDSERRMIWIAFIAAIVGSITLFVLPAYSGSDCLMGEGSASPLCESTSRTFLEANGRQVIPYFTLPVLVAAVPFIFLGKRMRALVFAVCAFLLAAQSAVGMSGYGIAFAPSSVILVLAGFLGIFSESKQ